MDVKSLGKCQFSHNMKRQLLNNKNQIYVPHFLYKTTNQLMNTQLYHKYDLYKALDTV